MSENLNNEEIKAYINGLEIQIANYISTNSDLLLKVERLKAEVERLRKAGDAMADFFVPDIDDLGHNYGFKKSVESVISNWNAAKEGKQS